MKIISWNVNGIRACMEKGFLKFIEEKNPDIICLQEIKAHPEQVLPTIRASGLPYDYIIERTIFLS